ncbi:TetR/AcrR family transcriptional regulator [Oceanicaulis alexandrii]|uniref:TetR/AcrR family transcriptional regulator n=1 Tax=Oceanicaulis alexandrii TaxID=153233 RepID=UPI0035CEAE73
MGRKALIDNDSLFEKISDAFRADGYEGASLARLSEATGLKKASLYHRFPGGKDQMASEILDWDVGRLAEYVSADLGAEGSAQARLSAMSETLRAFYHGGASACLLNRLTGSTDALKQFSEPVASAFHALRDAITDVLVETGLTPDNARQRAEDGLMLIQGALIYAQATHAPEVFARVIQTLPERLLQGRTSL